MHKKFSIGIKYHEIYTYWILHQLFPNMYESSMKRKYMCTRLKIDTAKLEPTARLGEKHAFVKKPFVHSGINIT